LFFYKRQIVFNSTLSASTIWLVLLIDCDCSSVFYEFSGFWCA